MDTVKGGSQFIGAPHYLISDLTMSETSKLIEQSLETIEHTFTQDTELSLKQLETLRQINTNTTLKLIRKEEELKSLSWRTEKILVLNKEINQLVKELDGVEAKVAFVEELTKELDDFTKAL